MIVDKACFERGCACYDDRVDGPGVEVLKKEWQGLTEAEINEVLGSDIHDEPSGLLDFVRAIEQALKEKNT